MAELNKLILPVQNPSTGEITNQEFDLPSGGGGGSSSFEALTDVDIDAQTLANGNVPVYNSTTQKWENGRVSYDNLSGKPTLGTAADKDVPESGNASSAQVVLGSDTRLTDARIPVSHTHTKSEITDFPTLGTAAAKNSTNSVTSGSTSLVESGAVYSEVNTLNNALSNKVNVTDIVNNLTETTTGKVLDATQGFALANKHKVTRFTVGTSSWVSDTTSQSGTTLYKKSIALSHVYVNSPSVDIGSTGVLPTNSEQENYRLLKYVTVDSTIPCLYLYSGGIPDTTFYINVIGVD